jgi:hypothetical protein
MWQPGHRGAIRQRSRGSFAIIYWFCSHCRSRSVSAFISHFQPQGTNCANIESDIGGQSLALVHGRIPAQLSIAKRGWKSDHYSRARHDIGVKSGFGFGFVPSPSPQSIGPFHLTAGRFDRLSIGHLECSDHLYRLCTKLRPLPKVNGNLFRRKFRFLTRIERFVFAGSLDRFGWCMARDGSRGPPFPQ